MPRMKRKACKKIGGYARKNQMAAVTGSGKKIEYNVSYESCFYAHYFSCNKDQDDGKELQIKDDYRPFITMAKTFTDDQYKVDNINIIDQVIDSDMEYWCGLHEASKYDGSGMLKYGRPNLQLVFVLDISGSMSNNFTRNSTHSTKNKISNMSKIEVAKKVLIKFLTQLNDNDYFGLCVFNNQTKIIHDIQLWGATNKKQVIKKINALTAGGGTKISNAFNVSSKMLLDCPMPLQLINNLQKNTQKRLFFLTDMEVSTDEGNQYTKSVSEYAMNHKIYSSVSGIGLDLSNGVITRLSKTVGCNYSNILDADSFSEILNSEFNYMVTPIAFNIKLTILSDHEMEAGFGSFEVRDINGSKECKQISRFPSLCDYKGNLRSGIILLKLNPAHFKKPNNNLVKMKINYDDINGKKHEILFQKDFNTIGINEFENTGIKKAIILKNYVDFIQFYLKSRLKYNPTKQEINRFKQYKQFKFKQYFDYILNNLIQLNDITLMEELRVLNWIGCQDNIRLVQQNIDNIQIWHNIMYSIKDNNVRFNGYSFLQNKCHKNLRLSNNNQIVTVNTQDGWSRRVHLNKIMKTGIHYIKFQIYAIIKDINISIGISSPKSSVDRFVGFDQHSYSYSCCGKLQHKSDADYTNPFASTWNTTPYTSGDTISMELNLNNSTLSYFKNDRFLGKAFDIRDCGDIGYTFAVSMAKENSRVQIIQYKNQSEIPITLFTNFIKIINTTYQINLLIIGYLRNNNNQFNDTQISNDVLKIIGEYFLPAILNK